MHQSFNELSREGVDIATSVTGSPWPVPFYINAMTGGAEALTQVNRRLAQVAERTGSAMAVGSQFAGLEFPEVAESFRVVRSVNPQGIIWANIGAYATVEEARRVGKANLRIAPDEQFYLGVGRLLFQVGKINAEPAVVVLQR